MPLRALIWDVDGTLAETERDGHLPAFNQAFAEAGPPFSGWHWDDATYADLLRTTGGKERMLRWWQQQDLQAASAAEATAQVAALHARKTQLYAQRVAAGAVALRPGVAALIQQARAAGLRQAIATTTQPDNVQALLTHTLGADAPAWFDAIGAGDVVPHKKPAPDIYHWVLQRLNLQPNEAVAIEDSAVGAAAARAAGLRVLVVRSAYTAHEAIAATWLLQSLEGPALGLSGLLRLAEDD
jgi:HAD superfamily hydrolase (TIGR01509 family)